MAVKCKRYEAIEIGDNENCVNCRKWTGKKCRDEAMLIADWEKAHGAYDRQMRTNRGARIE